MTPPIQEPSSARDQSGTEWATRQLARRPPLVATTNNPWIVLFDGATTVPNNTSVPVPFRELAYDPALVSLGFAPNPFDVDTTDTGDPGNTRYRVLARVKGVYRVELWTAWTDTTTDPGYAMQELFGVTTPSSILYGNENIQASADWPTEMLENANLFFNQTVFLNQAWTFDPYTTQSTGADREVTGVRFYVEYMQYSDQSTWTFDSI